MMSLGSRPVEDRVTKEAALAMTTAERCPTRTPLRSTQRVAIAGFLVGYTSNTHASRTTDLRIFARWCRDNRLMLLAVRRVHLELFARWMESQGPMPSTAAGAGRARLAT